MLKLLKYDFKSFIWKHIALLAVLLINAIIVRFTNYLIIGGIVTGKAANYLSLIHGILINLFYVTLVVVPLMTFVMVISRYRKKVLSDEAYLTHTLPLEKRDILIAGNLNALIYIFIDAIGIILALFIMLESSFLKDQVTVILESNMITNTIVLLLMVVGIMVFINQFILAFTLGYSHETNKVRNTIIYGIVIYLVNQFLAGIVLFVGFLIMFSISKFPVEKLALGFALLYYIGVFVVTYSIINYSLKNRLNLE